jgi:hypothetical protein
VAEVIKALRVEQDPAAIWDYIAVDNPDDAENRSLMTRGAATLNFTIWSADGQPASATIPFDADSIQKTKAVAKF